jgi:hypothetical protein
MAMTAVHPTEAARSLMKEAVPNLPADIAPNLPEEIARNPPGEAGPVIILLPGATDHLANPVAFQETVV